MASFTGVGDTTTLSVDRKGEEVAIAISGTYNMTIAFQREVGSPGGGGWETINTYSTANATVAETYYTRRDHEELRLIVLVDTSGTATATLTNNADEQVRQSLTDGQGTDKIQFTQAGVTIPSDQTLTVAGTTTFSGGLTVSGTLNAVESTETLAAADTLTAAESGKVIFLSSATEFATTLPALAAGLRFTFYVTAAPSGASYTIVSSAANIVGHVVSSDLDAVADADFETSGATTITLVDGVAVKGDRVDLVCDGTNWYATCYVSAVGGATISGA